MFRLCVLLYLEKLICAAIRGYNPKVKGINLCFDYLYYYLEKLICAATFRGYNPKVKSISVHFIVVMTDLHDIDVTFFTLTITINYEGSG